MPAASCHDTSEATAAKRSDSEERTLMDPSVIEAPDCEDRECCLVQIYPAEIVDGMVLMERDTLIAGRDESCELWLADSSVSRRHAEFRRINDSYEVSDLGSTNGTLVNGDPVRSRLLVSGDSIKLGSYLFKFLSAGSIETAYYETVYSAMTIDALTGAFNKSYLLDNLNREIARAQRHDRPLALVMTDIDKFKLVNDTHGHLVGDEVLKEFGRRLSEVSREDDLFARYGGEEFSLVLSETPLESAVQITERCRAAIASEPFVTAAGPLEITASFGLTMLTDDRSVTPEDLIGEADAFLYQAKHAGRNCVVGPL